MTNHDPCPCGTSSLYDQCCGPLLRGEKPAPTAEALMRSRYTAYVLANADYLLASWHPHTRPPDLKLDNEQKWLGLKIRKTVAGLASDCEGVVEFIARFKVNGRGHKLHETSRFVRWQGCWVYVDGEQQR